MLIFEATGSGAHIFEFLFKYIMPLLKLGGALGLFLFGMKMMSDGLQRASSERLEYFLNHITSNRFVAVLTGFFVTALIQSSSATTVMAVSFVNAGLMSLVQSIGVIMGANIGTTITGWLVSLLGFKVKIAVLALPIIAIGLPFYLSKKGGKRVHWGEFFIGFGILFIGLSFMKDIFPKPGANEINFLIKLSEYGHLSNIIFLLAGALITVVVHSSSASMAIVLTMAHGGSIPFEAAAAMILGSNIGTTIDALLAGIGAKVNARRAALVHILFNIMGSIIALILLGPYLKFVAYIIPGSDITLELSAFHTIFNIVNTLIFIGFVKQFAQLVEKIIKPNAWDKANEKYTLKYIEPAFQNAVEFHILNVRKEVESMINIAEGMLSDFAVFVSAGMKPPIAKKLQSIQEREDYTDQMQEELTHYLLHTSSESHDDNLQFKINGFMRIINELESIGDSCCNLFILSRRKEEKKISLSDEALQGLNDYIQEATNFFKLIHEYEKTAHDEYLLKEAYKLENDMNNSRDRYKRDSRTRIKKGSDIKAELLYMDYIRYLEQIGDFCLNIVQAMQES